MIVTRLLEGIEAPGARAGFPLPWRNGPDEAGSAVQSAACGLLNRADCSLALCSLMQTGQAESIEAGFITAGSPTSLPSYRSAGEITPTPPSCHNAGNGA